MFSFVNRHSSIVILLEGLPDCLPHQSRPSRGSFGISRCREGSRTYTSSLSEASIGRFRGKRGIHQCPCSANTFDRVPTFQASFFPQEVLILAIRTIKRASIPLDDSSNRGPASDAFFSISLENHKVILMLSRNSIGVYKIRKACSPTPDREPQHFAYSIDKARNLLRIQSETPAQRMDSS